MQSYQWNARDYEKHSQGQQVWALELLDKLQLRGDEQVLDLGCGDGRVTREIARRIPTGSVMGVDSSKEMIEFAAASHPHLPFQVTDARELKLERRFDVVFSNAALHWVRDHRPVVAGLARCLRPGGRILLQMGGRGNAAGILSVLDEVVRSPAWRSYFTAMDFPYGFLGPEEYQGLMDAFGFVEPRIELIPKEMVHADPAAFAGWIRTTWLPYTRRVPESLRAGFIDEIVEAYMQRFPPDAKGRVHVEMVRIEVAATLQPS